MIILTLARPPPSLVVVLALAAWVGLLELAVTLLRCADGSR